MCLGLATPVAIMVGNGMGAKNGIMFKTAVSLEETGKMEIVALDKTGTITSGEPQVTDILPANGISESELLVLAYILEKKSEHPLAKAITGRVESEVEQSEREKLTEVSGFQAVPGNGLSGKIDGAEVLGGNLNYIGQYSEVSEEMKRQAEHLSEQGKTPLSSARTEHLWELLQWLMLSKKTAHRQSENFKIWHPRSYADR